MIDRECLHVKEGKAVSNSWPLRMTEISSVSSSTQFQRTSIDFLEDTRPSSLTHADADSFKVQYSSDVHINLGQALPNVSPENVCQYEIY